MDGRVARASCPLFIRGGISEFQPRSVWNAPSQGRSMLRPYKGNVLSCSRMIRNARKWRRRPRHSRGERSAARDRWLAGGTVGRSRRRQDVSGRGGILKGLAADVEAAHGGGVGGTIEEAAAFDVTVTGDSEIHRFLRGGEIARIEGGFVGVEKRENAEHLIVE